MKIKAGPIILFFIIYIWAYAIFNAVNAKADEPTITIPYTEEQMCKVLLRAEICDMSQAEQEQYFLEMFKALIEQKLNEDSEEKEIESMEICFKETEQGKLIPCKGTDV